jgi:hypothetical protein
MTSVQAKRLLRSKPAALAEFALQQALRSYGNGVIDKLRRFGGRSA